MTYDPKKLPVIALLGKARSGKDTVGGMLLEAAPSRAASTAFAWKLKQIVGEMFGLSEHDLYDDKGKEQPTRFGCLRCPSCGTLECELLTLDGTRNGRCKLCGSIGDINVFNHKWTPRTILQYLGTEGFRRVDPEVWVRYALETCTRELDGGARFVTITDCRFRSEAEAVWARGGQVWKIKRPSLEGESKGLKGHQSETEQDSIRDDECQAVIVNDGTLDVLRARVNVQLGKFLESY